MQDRVGEDFQAIILSCTKYGFFVELDRPLHRRPRPHRLPQPTAALSAPTKRTVMSSATPTAPSSAPRSGRVFRIGQPVRVLLDRIDRQQRRLQFSLLEAPASQPAPPQAPPPSAAANTPSLATS